MKKYILHPGYMYSNFDGDKHYISAFQLCLLYSVKWSECVVYVSDNSEGIKDLISLYPRSDGNYNIKKQNSNCFQFSSSDWRI